MISDYQIYCTKTEWSSGTELENVNYFSDAIPIGAETVDITDYIWELGSLTFSFDCTDENNNLYFEDSDINIKLRDNAGSSYFENFFEIYTNNNFIKYQIKIYQGSELLYTGIVNLDRLKQAFTRGRGNRNIEIQALGMIKEFKNYYSNKDLTSSDNINWIYTTTNLSTHAMGYIDTSPYSIVENDTVTIGGEVYTFKASPRYGYPFDVLLGSDNISCILNLHNKINSISSIVTSSRNINPLIYTLTITSKLIGNIGNSYAFTTTSLGLTLSPDNGYLSGGLTGTTESDHKILLTDLLSSLITIPVQVDLEIQDYYVTRDSVLTKRDSTNHNYTLYKSCYGNIQGNGENIFGFLKKLSFAMGWLFYIDKGVLKIKNRSIQDTSAKRTLDYNNFLSPLEFTRQENNRVFNAVYISDGEFYGGSDAGFGDIRRGSSLYIFNNTFDFPTETTPFYMITGTSGLAFSGIPIPNHRWVKLRSVDDNKTELAIYEDYYTGGGFAYGGYNRALDAKDILFINGGDTGNYGWVFDTANGVNRYHTRNGDIGIGGTDVYFKGNYGNCLFKIQDDGKYFTYQDYMQTDLAKDNFNKFLKGNMVNKCSIKIKEAIFNPLEYYDFTNKPDAKLDGEWKINRLETDLNKNISKIQLQKKL